MRIYLGGNWVKLFLNQQLWEQQARKKVVEQQKNINFRVLKLTNEKDTDYRGRWFFGFPSMR